MTENAIPVDVLDSSDLEDVGWYNWRVAAPGNVVMKDEYDSNGKTERQYKAVNAFLVATEAAKYSKKDGLLTDVTPPIGVSISVNFKITKPDGTWDKKGLAKLKSLFVVNTGTTPRTVEDDDGRATYDLDLIANEMVGFTGWAPIVHGEDKENDKKFQYVQGNFRKSAPEKVKI